MSRRRRSRRQSGRRSANAQTRFARRGSSPAEGQGKPIVAVSRRRSLVFGVLLLLLLAGLLAAERVSVYRSVELRLTADQGDTRIALTDKADNAVSPGCGCMDPSFGSHPWFGFSLPSEGFDLSVAVGQGRSVKDRRWALTAMVPSLEPINWFGDPARPVHMRVTVDRAGARSRIFAARASFAILLSDQSVEVRHGDRYPYAALLPGASGSTRFQSRAGPQPGFGAQLNVASGVPARDAATDDELAPGYEPRTDLVQRGPMVDLLGPNVTLRVDDSVDLRLFAGLEEIRGFVAGDAVEVSITTPFALRLISHPAPPDSASELAGAWKRERARLLRDKNPEQAGVDARLQSRFKLTDALPAYSVRLRHLVSRAGNSLKKSCEGRQDLLGGLGPDERPGVMVPCGHPGADVLLERLD